MKKYDIIVLELVVVIALAITLVRPKEIILTVLLFIWFFFVPGYTWFKDRDGLLERFTLMNFMGFTCVPSLLFSLAMIFGALPKIVFLIVPGIIAGVGLIKK